MVNFNDKNINYLNLMANANTAIKCSKGGLVIAPKEGAYSPTTLNKIERISHFLANQADTKENQECLKSLKNKLIKESHGNEAFIAKVKDLVLHRGEWVSPSISIVEKTKPFEIVKFGLIFEQGNLLTNSTMYFDAEKLLMHGTPVIVNREFLVAHRHMILHLKFPCQCFHQKDGNLSIIIPSEKRHLENLGFNKKEFIQGSFTKLPPLYQTTAARDLDQILLNETSEKNFLRVEETHGHGSPSYEDAESYIAGLPIKEFLDVQSVLKKKGTVFGIVDTCFGGGDHINTIKQTAFPILVASSSELPSRGGKFDPSYDGILDYVSSNIQKGELKFDETSLFSNENVHEILSHIIMENAPQLILPSNEPVAITPLSRQHQSFKRLQKNFEKQTIILEGTGGFISPGGTKNHLLKEVIASEHDIQGIAKGTFSQLDLSDSPVKKGIFIGKMECKRDPSDWFSKDFNKVMIYASKENNFLLFSKLDLFNRPEYFYCFFNSPQPELNQLNQLTEESAYCNYYLNFARTIQKRGEEGKSLLLEFQKTLFGKAANLPLHRIYSTIVKASLYDHGVEKRNECFRSFQDQLKENFSKEEMQSIYDLAKELKLPLFANIAESALAPELIQHIWHRKEDSTLTFLKKANHPELLIQERDLQNKSPLCWALHSDQMDLFEYLIEKTKEISKNWDNSAFLEACRKGTPKILGQILQVGNAKIQDVDSGMILRGLENALQSKNQEMVDYLIDNASASSFKEILTPVILLLVKHNQVKILESFLKTYCHNDIPQSLAAPLCLSISNIDIGAVKILLNHGADLNTPTNTGFVPLVVLSMSPPSDEHMEIFDLLMKKGGQVDLADRSGNTPLVMAMKNRNVPLMQALIKAGASLNVIHKGSIKTPFLLAMCESSLMKPFLESCTLEQLEKDPQLDPLTMALESQDFQLADHLTKKKGMKCKTDELLEGYLASAGTQAKIKAIQWILQHGNNWASNWSTHLQRTAIQNCTLETVQAIESLIHVTEAKDFPIKNNIELLEDALSGYLDYIAKRETFPTILKSDKKALYELNYGPEKAREEMVLHYLNQVKDFEKPGIELLSLCSAIGNQELYQHLLDLMIANCKTEHFQPFYRALQKGNLNTMKACFKTFNKKDIASAWEYLPPPFLISGLKNPSQEFIQAILDQMKYANLSQLDEDKRIPILLKMAELSGDDLAMKYQIISHATMDEVWRYFKIQLGMGNESL